MDFFNYGREKDVQSKYDEGMFRTGYQYTTDVYFDPVEAGRKLGIAVHNVEVVLKFKDDGKFRPGPDVVPVPNRGFTGGGTQFEHPGRPKPVAKRKIVEKVWTPL